MKRKPKRSRMVFYVTLKSQNKELNDINLKREELCLYDVQKNIIYNMPDELRDSYYIHDISEGIPLPSYRKKVKRNMSEANTIAWRKRICRKLLKIRDQYKIDYPSTWDIKFNSYIKKHNPNYRSYFDYNYNLIDEFMLDDD
jgi:cell wall assembly regulator SMI1